MARLAKTVANNKKIKLAKKHMNLRKELRSKAKDLNLSEEERFQAGLRLQKLPKNSSMARVRNRCEITGHPRAVYSKFKLSRMAFRKLALQGMLPGVTKSSW